MLIKTPGNGDPRIIDISESQLDKYLGQGSTVATEDDIIAYKCKLNKPPEGFLEVYLEGWSQNNLLPTFGYGTVAYNLVQTAHRGGISLNPKWKGQKIALVYKPVTRPDKTLSSDLEKLYNRFSDADRPYIVTYTMFETTKWPERWIDILSRCTDLILVPSLWCKDTLIAQGITKSIEILGHGTDPEFTYIDRPENTKGPFRFLHYNSGELRKSYRETIDAFCNEFTEADNVELVLKSSTHAAAAESFLYVQEKRQAGQLRANIQLVHKIMAKTELQELLASCHCFVFPSKGEGFGLTPLEAIKTGMPAILTKGHAFLDFWNVACLGVGYDLEPAKYGAEYFKGTTDYGNWYKPRVSDIQAQMRFAYTNQIDSKGYGRVGSEYISGKFTWDIIAQNLKEIIKKYV